MSSQNTSLHMSRMTVEEFVSVWEDEAVGTSTEYKSLLRPLVFISLGLGCPREYVRVRKLQKHVAS
jgi:hypothetical protein